MTGPNVCSHYPLYRQFADGFDILLAVRANRGSLD
jgi:hypothetical protein